MSAARRLRLVARLLAETATAPCMHPAGVVCPCVAVRASARRIAVQAGLAVPDHQDVRARADATRRHVKDGS